MWNNLKKRGAFTLIELMVAVFILLVSLVGITLLISRVFSYSAKAHTKLVLVYLCQEGIEIVRNIRDSNWVSGAAWDQGLVAGDWEADYNDIALVAQSGVGRRLRLNDGFYNYDSGGQTEFRRKIHIERPSADEIQITVSSFWPNPGSAQIEISVYESLYNWNR